MLKLAYYVNLSIFLYESCIRKSKTIPSSFDMIFQSIGIEIKKQPPFTPMMNSRMENFIRAIKTECLDKISLPMSGSFRFAVKEYLEYWNHYRLHAGLDGRKVLPYPQDAYGKIQEISFHGGLLHGYRQVKQAA